MSRVISLKVDWDQYDFGPRDEEAEDWMLKGSKLRNGMYKTFEAAEILGIDQEPLRAAIRWDDPTVKNDVFELSQKEQDTLYEWCSMAQSRLEANLDFDEIERIKAETPKEEYYKDHLDDVTRTCYTAFLWVRKTKRICELAYEHDRPLEIG